MECISKFDDVFHIMLCASKLTRLGLFLSNIDLRKGGGLNPSPPSDFALRIKIGKYDPNQLDLYL